MTMELFVVNAIKSIKLMSTTIEEPSQIKQRDKKKPVSNQTPMVTTIKESELNQGNGKKNTTKKTC